MAKVQLPLSTHATASIHRHVRSAHHHHCTKCSHPKAEEKNFALFITFYSAMRAGRFLQLSWERGRRCAVPAVRSGPARTGRTGSCRGSSCPRSPLHRRAQQALDRTRVVRRCTQCQGREHKARIKQISPPFKLVHRNTDINSTKYSIRNQPKNKNSKERMKPSKPTQKAIPPSSSVSSTASPMSYERDIASLMSSMSYILSWISSMRFYDS